MSEKRELFIAMASKSIDGITAIRLLLPAPPVCFNALHSPLKPGGVQVLYNDQYIPKPFSFPGSGRGESATRASAESAHYITPEELTVR